MTFKSNTQRILASNYKGARSRDEKVLVSFPLRRLSPAPVSISAGV